MKKYSAQNNAFYDPQINSEIPADAIDIDEPAWMALLEGQADGRVISSSKEGLPLLVESPEPTAEQIQKQVIAEQQRLRQYADSAIYTLQDAIDMKMASEKEIEQLTSWKKYRIALMRIETNVLDVNWPQIPV